MIPKYRLKYVANLKYCRMVFLSPPKKTHLALDTLYAFGNPSVRWVSRDSLEHSNMLSGGPASFAVLQSVELPGKKEETWVP